MTSTNLINAITAARKDGVRNNSFLVLLYLYHYDITVKAVDLTKLCDSTFMGVYYNLRDLKKMGLVEQISEPEGETDGRVRPWQITPKGKEKFEEWKKTKTIL